MTSKFTEAAATRLDGLANFPYHGFQELIQYLESGTLPSDPSVRLVASAIASGLKTLDDARDHYIEELEKKYGFTWEDEFRYVIREVLQPWARSLRAAGDNLSQNEAQELAAHISDAVKSYEQSSKARNSFVP